MTDTLARKLARERRFSSEGTDGEAYFVLGLADGTVKTGNPYEAFARDLSGHIVRVINQKCPNIAGTPVYAEFRDGRYWVTRVRQRYPVPMSEMPEHAESHERFGPDPDFVEGDRFLPDLLTPIPRGLSLRYYGGLFYDGTDIATVPAQDVNLVGSIPAAPGNSRWALVEKVNDGTLNVVNGSTVLSDLLSETDIPAATAGSQAIWAVRCINGATEFIHSKFTSDMFDLRFARGSGSGGGGAWGSITGTLADQADLHSVLVAKVDKNSAITGSTKTKITYDAKGLVTGGTDASTSDISEGSNLYFTVTRVLSSALTGFTVAATRTAIVATDTLLEALGKVQKYLNDLGGAAWLNVGTTPGTVAAGDDSRLSNERVPTAQGIADKIHAAAAKTTPEDTDEDGIWDNDDSLLKKVTWANRKATLKTYFDTLYYALTKKSIYVLGGHGNGATVPAGATHFICLFVPGVDTAGRSVPVKISGRLQDLTFRLASAQPASGTLVIEIYVEDGSGTMVATGIKITIPAGSAAGTYTDWTHTYDYTAGRLMHARITNNATGGAASGTIGATTWNLLYDLA